MTIYSRIAGTGGYLPEEVRTNGDISKLVDTSDEWIFERTGIRERRIAGADETASSMAEVAARCALDAAGLQAAKIDLIIVATCSPDTVFPSTGFRANSLFILFFCRFPIKCHSIGKSFRAFTFFSIS